MRDFCNQYVKSISILDVIIYKCRYDNLYYCKHRIDHICIYYYSEIPEKLQENKINKISYLCKKYNIYIYKYGFK
jgi:hypothetical protein